MKKIISISFLICLFISMLSIKPTYAIEPYAKFQELKIGDEKIALSTNINDNYVICESISEKGENNIYVFNKTTKIATLNGRNINLVFSQYNENEGDISKLLKSSSPYTPVYVYTRNISFKNVVKSVGAIVTVIGGVIATASLTGLALPSIAGIISNWSSAVGLGSLAAGYLCSGNFSYKLYRTKSPVKFGVATSAQIAYRYQDSKVNFKVKKKTMYHSYNKVGSWWYATKPV